MTRLWAILLFPVVFPLACLWYLYLSVEVRISRGRMVRRHIQEMERLLKEDGERRLRELMTKGKIVRRYRGI